MGEKVATFPLHYIKKEGSHMNGKAVRWVVSGALALGAVIVIAIKKKQNKKPETKYNSPADDKPNHLAELKEHIIINAIRCGLQKEIPGWKRVDIPDEEKISELSRLASIGWGRITVSIIHKMSEEGGMGTGSETSG